MYIFTNTYFNIADSELVHQLEEEMKFEEADVKNEVPAFVQEFLENKLFEVK